MLHRPLVTLFWLTGPVLVTPDHALALTVDCFFPQICVDSGAGCTLASILFSVSSTDAEAFGRFPDGTFFLVGREKGDAVSLFVTAEGTGKLTRLERKEGHDVASIAHGACKLKE